MEPRSNRAKAEGKELSPEVRLEIGLFASLFIPTSLLIFGFTSRESVPWIAPVIGAALYLPGIFLNFQSILMYVTSAYPMYAASVLAGNDLFRSSIASVFPLFGRLFFENLGLGPGSALLAGVSLLLMPVFWVRYLSFRFYSFVLTAPTVVNEMGSPSSKSIQVCSQCLNQYIGDLASPCTLTEDVQAYDCGSFIWIDRFGALRRTLQRLYR